MNTELARWSVNVESVERGALVDDDEYIVQAADYDDAIDAAAAAVADRLGYEPGSQYFTHIRRVTS